MNKRENWSLGGMTLNERLSYVSILGQWDAAVRDRNRNLMIALLAQVEVSEPHLTVDAVLARLRKEGG